MASLIIRCPARPVASPAEDWSVQDLYFSWAYAGQGDFQRVIDLDLCPMAEHVIAIVPGIDVRILELKVPAVSTKKIIQILPMLIEDELLSTATDTSIQLLPPVVSSLPDRRLVSLINREWLLWLSVKLAATHCEKIQLIPESLLLPGLASTVFFHQEDATSFYTLKDSPYTFTCWSQPTTEPLLAIAEPSHKLELVEISDALLIKGVSSEIGHYEAINLLPQEFYEYRRARHSESLHWFSRDLWKSPLRWTRYATLTLCLSYACYFAVLVWQDWQWNTTLDKATQQVLSERVGQQVDFTRLVSASCDAAHRNLETCSGDFERLLPLLQRVLQDTPPEALKSLEYSKQGLIFELQESSLSTRQHLAILKNYPVTRVDSARYLLRPYAGLAYD